MNTKTTKISAGNILIILVYLTLFIYVCLRAYYLSFTHDESLSFLILYDPHSMAQTTANNHVLNTILMGICSLLYGKSELALRLPNVLSFGLYLTACYYLLKDSKNFFLILLGSSVFILNPFLIEFFSLARGYGISMGCMMMSIYFTLRNSFQYESFQVFVKDYKLAILFASLAVLANLSVINYLIATILVFILQYVLLSKKSSKIIQQKPINKNILLITIIPVLVGLLMLLFLSLKNQLYIGEQTLNATLNSTIENSLYFSTYPTWVFESIKYLVIVFFPLGLISIIFKKDYFGKFFIITILILFVIIGLILEHFLFHANYPGGRTALIFIPLFGLFIYYFILHLKEYYLQNKVFVILCSLGLTIPLLFHFTTNMNLFYTKTWQYDAHTKEVIFAIEKHTNKNKPNLSVSCEWIFEPTINFYINTRKMKINRVSRDGIDLTSDFIYNINYDGSIPSDFEVVASYDEIGTIFFKKTDFNINSSSH